MKKEIWTFLETDGEGNLSASSKELLAQAGMIAEKAGKEDKYTVRALLAGGDHGMLESAAKMPLQGGGDAVSVLEGEALSVYSAEFYADAIGRSAVKENPAMILFERTTDGMDLAPRLAAWLGAGMISDVVDAKEKDGRLVWIRHAFGGTAAVSALFRPEEKIQIVSIRPGSFGGAGREGSGKDAAGKDAAGREGSGKDAAGREESGKDSAGRGCGTAAEGPAEKTADYPAGETYPAGGTAGGTVEVTAVGDRVDAAASGKADAIEFVSYSPADADERYGGEKIVRPGLIEVLEAASDRGADIGTASVIVAGGNGAGPAGFELIEELAELLHGAVGASRIAVDKGWISHAHLIGQSGITVTPDLYINCGISGSVQHIVGMRDAGCVISINKDPKALIFNVSDYGIVGDLHKVLPALIAEIRRHRS